MSAQEVAAPKLDDIKKECRQLETSLKNEPNPAENLDKIEAGLRAIVNGGFGPTENVEYFLRTMLPKFIVLLLKRGCRPRLVFLVVPTFQSSMTSSHPLQ